MHISVVLHDEPERKKNEQKEEIKLKTESMVSPKNTTGSPHGQD